MFLLKQKNENTIDKQKRENNVIIDFINKCLFIDEEEEKEFLN